MGTVCCSEDSEKIRRFTAEDRHRPLHHSCCPDEDNDGTEARTRSGELPITDAFRGQLPCWNATFAQARLFSRQWGLTVGGSSRDCAGKDTSENPRGSSSWTCARVLESLLAELFQLHDLNGNGLMEEEELVQLNVKIAMLHHGRDIDAQAVKAQYRHLFREQFDPHGKPVAYAVFRTYMLRVLAELDRDPQAQEMIMEQFVAEAASGRAMFSAPSFASVSDLAIFTNIPTKDTEMKWCYLKPLPTTC